MVSERTNRDIPPRAERWKQIQIRRDDAMRAQDEREFFEYVIETMPVVAELVLALQEAVQSQDTEACQRLVLKMGEFGDDYFKQAVRDVVSDALIETTTPDWEYLNKIFNNQ